MFHRWCKRSSPVILLAALVTALLFLPLGGGGFFGSKGDWDSQHVAIAQSLRLTMCARRTLLPQWVPLGAGCSVYDLAYYGLLRPDVLLSCLLVKVPMEYFIAGYAALEVYAAVLLCYFWLRRGKRRPWISFAGAALFASSACFYQTRHQIMFVSYLPFLLLALLGVDGMAETENLPGRSALPTQGGVGISRRRFVWGGGVVAAAVFLIAIHSFYYLPACICVIVLYGIHRGLCGVRRGLYGIHRGLCGVRRGLYRIRRGLYGVRRLGSRGGRPGLWRLALSILLGVGMAMVLLAPTALDILSTSKDGGSFAAESLQWVDMGLEGLLYAPYGCGMTLLVLYCLLLSLADKKRRFLAVGLLAAMALPVVSLALNGFLYARGKILIPFVPLLTMVAIDTLQELWDGTRHAGVAGRLFPAVFCFLPAVVSQWRPLALADGCVLLIWIIWWKKREKRMQDKGERNIRKQYSWKRDMRKQYRWKRDIRYRADLKNGAGGGRRTVSFWAILLVPILVSLGVSLSDFAPAGLRQLLGISGSGAGISREEIAGRAAWYGLPERASRGALAAAVSDAGYRFEILTAPYTNANLLLDGGMQRTALYSSISNDRYARFFYDTAGNAIPNNNRVALVPGQNPWFNYLMGVRYVLTKKGEIPRGYRALEECGGMVLAENKNVLPICYGVTQEAYEDWCGKWRLWEEVCGRGDVPGKTTVRVAEEDLRRLTSRGPGEGKLTLHLEEPLRHQIVVVRFHVNRWDGGEVVISVNGVRNKLSAKHAPYPNGNENFTYVLDAGEGLEQLSLRLSEGDYAVEGVSVCAVAREALCDVAYVMPETKPVVPEAGHGTPGKQKNISGASDSMTKIRDGTLVYAGTIAMGKAGYFLTSYPWRAGYRVTVDGKTQEYACVNTAFVGFPISEGKHEIVISFQAPGYAAGKIISICSWMAFALAALGRTVRKRRMKKERIG